MLTTLFAQTVLLPVLLVLFTAVIHHLFYAKGVQGAGALALASSGAAAVGDSAALAAKRGLPAAWFLLLLWLPAYFCITQRFVLLPSLSSDWLPFYILGVSVGACAINYFQTSRWWLMAFTAVIAIAIAWPLLRYDFSWQSHLGLLSQVTFWLCVFVFFYSEYFLRTTKNATAILLLMVNGSLGLVVVLHSSLMLGLLVCAYACVFLLAACAQVLLLAKGQRLTKPWFEIHSLRFSANQQYVLWGFTGLLLGVAWFYVQIPLLLTLMLLGAMVVPIFYRGVGQVVVSALFAGAAVCYAVVEQVMLAPAYAY
ncbi:hypothetical protein QFX18_04505 [Saccharophagus degradans]|uniref:hypothetical protein n=1 Tax=Saccharophagus degradans TaxID=86304 RepID=UPI002477DA02|nr:hypothetical protein [Saccharophagus degradans]WGO99320.1 hypothetical protein QFX18_04505 [Saccharophagus degradans]